jgi:diguanylate cyclase (GGDEF)-like protein/putative nucleotidyltransferase with HDIG domain
MNKWAKAFIAVTTVPGALLMFLAFAQWNSQDPVRFIAYLGITLLASNLTVVLPGINGSMSVTFLFILLGILELSLPETMAIGCAATLLQCFTKMNRPTTGVRVLFNVCGMMAPAIWVSHWIYHASAPLLGNSMPLMVTLAGAAYFVANTVPIAAVLSLVEGRRFRKVWSEFYFWSFPYYLAGGALVALVHFINRYVGWQASLLVLPVVYWIFRSYRLYLGKLQDEKRHVEEMASLHLRTIEALALAIDAKDHTTHDHLQRVRIYALEIANELGLPPEQIEALKAAAMLHDIGKLAVPEHIISKPGKLTAEEFEKMKIHPLVGAEILKRVQFPYPVVPIVRAHHEKWDGSGYPDGLKGEDIPIGARILSVVDCLDALATDRQYRRAMPLDRAMEHVARLAGREFDPKIVEILERRYIELEQMAKAAPALEELSLATDMKIERGSAPAAGFQQESASQLVASPSDEHDFLTSIAAARQEAQTLFEITHDLGKSLSLDETLSVVSARLRKLVAYDSIAVWIRYGDVLVPKHVNGDNFRLFSSLEIPFGQGLSGWVVQNKKPIINGNPSVEPGYLNDPNKFSTLRSALSVPLEGVSGVIGAMTLYRAEMDGFSRDNLRVLLAISSKVALSIENAMRFQEAESSAITDYLTGLPNARSLFLHLDRELARCRRDANSLAVMVCDLNGFKLINDRHGHLQGNKVLRHFAQGLRDSCREYDYVARMGGDEFVIIAPGLKREAAQEKAIKLNQMALEAARHVVGAETLTASVGIAFFGEQGENAEQLLAEADRNMYLAKQSHYQRERRPLELVAKISAGVRSTLN